MEDSNSGLLPLQMHIWYKSTASTVGWSDLALFSIFESVHISADQVYFQELNSKKSAIFGCARASHARHSFHFQKSQGPYIFLFEHLHRPFVYIKEQSTKIKFEKYFCFIHITFYFPKMEKLFLIMYKVKINSFLNLSPFLAFK